MRKKKRRKKTQTKKEKSPMLMLLTRRSLTQTQVCDLVRGTTQLPKALRPAGCDPEETDLKMKRLLSVAYSVKNGKSPSHSLRPIRSRWLPVLKAPKPR